MKSAPLTSDEEERLKALLDYQILDTEGESVFDDLTLLASQICETPIALISLVDSQRQWFKSKVGLDADETSRDIAFCAHAIHQVDVFEVEDTLLDKRFFDNPLVTQDPNIRFYAGAPLITPNGQAIGTLCTISDAPKKLTEQQSNSLQILSREVISQLELRHKIKQLDIANKRKTEYLSNVSHELRTPLNAIISFSQIMLNDLDSKLVPQKYTQYLNHLDYSGRRLLEVVNSVLDLNKIEEGKMETEATCIRCVEFFESLEGMMSNTAREKGVVLSFSLDESLPKYIIIDSIKLHQIMLNLISNSIKFTAPQKRIDVTVKSAQDRLTINVEDQGKGISSADQKLLFDKFKQVESNRSSEGTGLGLTITKGLVELLQGQIKLVSSLGKGTLVRVTLPYITTDNGATNNDSVSQTQPLNPNNSILVVEDNIINQEVATAVFASLGCKIELVDNGEDAISRVNAKHYDIVFMDLHLPTIDGYQTAKQINTLLPQLPIVALSADAFASHKGKLDHPYIVSYLTKPINKMHLVSVLNQYALASSAG